MQQANLDINRLNELKIQLENIGEQRKGVKTEFDKIQNAGVDALLNLRVRYVDSSGSGSGPFWVLGKDRSDGSFNRERLNEFFRLLLLEFQANSNADFGPEKCTDFALMYLKQFEKRRLVLNKLTHCRTKGVDDLLKWLESGD